MELRDKLAELKQTVIDGCKSAVAAFKENGVAALDNVRELVSLQRRCSNNLNQVAIQANTYGGIYPDEITALQKDYADLWGPLADLLKKLAEVVKL